MDITEQIAAAEAKVAASTERFVNSGSATHDERRAIDAQLRQDLADLKALRAAAQNA